MVDKIGIFNYKTPVVTFCCSTNNNRKFNLKVINTVKECLKSKVIFLVPEFLNIKKIKGEEEITKGLEQLGIDRINMSDLVIFIRKDKEFKSLGESTQKELKYVEKKYIPYMDYNPGKYTGESNPEISMANDIIEFLEKMFI